MDNDNHRENSIARNIEDVFDGDFPLNQIFNFGIENQGHILMLLKEDWERRRRMCIKVLCYIVHMLHLLKFMSTRIDKSIDLDKEKIDLNGDDGYQNSEAEWNDGQGTPHSTSHVMGYSPELGVSSQSNGSSGTTSKGAKRKASLNDLIESEIERMNMSIQELTNVMRDVNYYYQRSIEIAEKQVEMAEKQVEIAEKQVEIAEKGLVILEQTRPRYYTENDVWSELEKLGVVPELHMGCYRFLCRDERANSLRNAP